MRFEFCGQGLDQGQIDIGSKVVDSVIRDIEICRRLQQVSMLIALNIVGEKRYFYLIDQNPGGQVSALKAGITEAFGHKEGPQEQQSNNATGFALLRPLRFG